MEVADQPFYAYDEVLATFADSPATSGTLLSAFEILASHVKGQPVAMPHIDERARHQALTKFARGHEPLVAQPPALPQPTTSAPAPVASKRPPSAGGTRVRHAFFVSYSRLDLDAHLVRFVQDLSQRVGEGLRSPYGPPLAFFDQTDVEPGESWPDAARDALCSAAETGDRMREEYDDVLVDSPTGVGHLAALCSVTLPDTLVVCFVMNRQSILGGVAVAQSARNSTVRPIDVFPVPMRVDLFEKDLIDASRAYAQHEFQEALTRLERREYWSDVEIPYVPYSYAELLAPFAETTRNAGSLLASVERLARHVTSGAVSQAVLPSAQERSRVLAEFQSRMRLPSRS